MSRSRKSLNIAHVILIANNHGVAPSPVFNDNKLWRVPGGGYFDIIVGNPANYAGVGNSDYITGALVSSPGGAGINPSLSRSPTKFTIAQSVTPNGTANVRGTAAGTLLGTQAVGAAGTPTPTPTLPPVTGSCAPPNYSACGYPDAINTGVPAGTTLTNVSGDCVRITTPNTVINGQHITGCIQVEANNVTIQNSKITSSNFYAIQYGRDNPSVTGLKVLHTTFDTVPNCQCYYTIQPLSTGSFEFGWNDISGYKNGVDINTGYLHDNYVHGIVQGPTDHTQAVFVWAGGDGVQIVHNTLIANIGSTASIYYADDSKRVGRGANGYAMDNNWLAGGNFAIYGGSDTSPTKVTITNNRFSTELSPNSGAHDIVVNFNRNNPDNAWYGNTWALGPKHGRHAGSDFGAPTPTSIPSPGPSPSDTAPPTIAVNSPSGQLPAGATRTTLSVTTNENATCAWGSTSGLSFASMTQFSMTGGSSHLTSLTGLANGTSYSGYVKCKDATGNISTDVTVSFSVASERGRPRMKRQPR